MDKLNLFIGYGNPDRGDDGAAYHIFRLLLKKFDRLDVDLFSSEVTPLNETTDIFFNFQLLPEYAEMVADYQKVVFIDAHTGEIDEEINFTRIEPNLDYSSFTHHFSPSSCLAIAQSLTKKCPKSWLLSVKGFNFGFNRNLSRKTEQLVKQAVELLSEEFL